MKYLIINGSPRHGHTWEIVTRVKNTLSTTDTNTTFTHVELIDENIPYCRGCFSCFENGEDSCPDSDKIGSIVDKIRECDGLIITSPVYALHITALLKNFIDHVAYLYHRPEFFTKKALIISTTAGMGHKKVGKFLDETLRNWGFNERFKLCLIDVHDTNGYLPLNIKEKIDKTTLKFYNSIESKKLKSPSMNALFMYNMWRAMAYNNHIPCDHDFWVENDLINHEYHPSIPCSFIKKMPCKIFYKLMLGFLSKNSVKKEEV